MLSQIPEEQRAEALFLNLILSLSNAAMIAMGKIQNPVTQKVETELPLAEVNIEMLAMLLNKTKGNLTEKEETFLTTTLTNLRMNYVKLVK